MRVAERIVSAAMLMDDGAIVPGVRHYSPEMRAVLRRSYGDGISIFGKWLIKPYHLRVVEQGFITNQGRFLSREEAWEVASTQKQILRNVSAAGTLYSENLY